MLNGTSFPEAAARTKKDARKHAAELALRILAGASAAEPVVSLLPQHTSECLCVLPLEIS